MNSIPGLEHLANEGWEVVRFDNLSQDEWFVDSEGRIVQWVYPGGSDEKKIIVRKIEKPKTYRPFANAAEAEALLGRLLRLKVNHKHKFVLIGISSNGFQIGLSHWSLREAFDSFEKLDGTPFGVEVTS